MNAVTTERRRRAALGVLAAGGIAVGLGLVSWSDGSARQPDPALPGLAPLLAAERGETLAARAQMRDYVGACRAATHDDAAQLRQIALTHPDPLVAGNAIAALARLDRVAGDRELLALMADARPRVRQELLWALGQDEAGRAQLAVTLESTATPERRIALLALVAGGDRSAAERVARTHPDPAERAFAQALLRQRRGGQVLARTGFVDPAR